MRLRYGPLLVSIFVVLLGTSLAIKPGEYVFAAQQPTGSVPTVTGTAPGPIVIVDPSLDYIRVYSGPSSFDYPAVGILLANEVAPALGRARDRQDWIQIYYPGVPGSTGWVLGLYVRLSAGAFLPLLDIPPTPTPISTPTINPTLEAAFIGQITPTKLPTFTPPAPLAIPAFSDQTDLDISRFPIGLMILTLGLFGFLGAVISYLRGR